jgi:midasin
MGNLECRAIEITAQSQLSSPPDELDTHRISASLQELERAVAVATHSMPRSAEKDSMHRTLDAARKSAAAACVPFVWEDGPLVTAMRQGCLLLIDEINLAEDAVLERLNSVLEPGRTLLLAEKGGPSADQIVAAEGFRVVATMNPGGDHGKRELSRALSNRFTQVRVSSVMIALHCPGMSAWIGKLPISHVDSL